MFHKTPIELLLGAVELGNTGKIKFVWCKDGKVIIRESESDPAVRIIDQDHLLKFNSKKGRNPESAVNTAVTPGNIQKKKFAVESNGISSCGESSNILNAFQKQLMKLATKT